MAIAVFERDAINRRTKHLAMARPFFALEGGKGHADLDLEKFDMRRVALLILDCIIVEMGGAQRGATYEAILRSVRPTLQAASPEISDSYADKVTSYALDALTNEREREAFCARYQVELNPREIKWVTVRYKLVDVRESPRGEIVYFADVPAINFYLSSLEIDIEAEQAAKDGAHEYYMQRGQFGDAGQNAEESLKLTISYREKLLRTTSLLSRDIRSVNYVAEIVPTLQQANEHIRTRMEKEARHLDDVDVRLDDARGDSLIQLARLKQIFQKTAAFYTSLATEVIGLDQVYLDEQARQRFRPSATMLGVGDPARQMMYPALSAPAHDVFEWVAGNVHAVHPASMPVIPSLVDTVALLLQDPQQRVGGDVAMDEGLQEVDPLVRFTPEDLEGAARLFDSFEVESRLSTLLQQGRADGVSPGTLRNVVLRAYQGFEDGGAFTATHAGTLTDPDYLGDDLLIRRSAE